MSRPSGALLLRLREWAVGLRWGGDRPGWQVAGQRITEPFAGVFIRACTELSAQVGRAYPRRARGSGIGGRRRFGRRRGCGLGAPWPPSIRLALGANGLCARGRYIQSQPVRALVIGTYTVATLISKGPTSLPANSPQHRRYHNLNCVRTAKKCTHRRRLYVPGWLSCSMAGWGLQCTSATAGRPTSAGTARTSRDTRGARGGGRARGAPGLGPVPATYSVGANCAS